MISRPALYRTAAFLMLGCSLQAERATWTFVLDNRSEYAWILQDPAAPSSAPAYAIGSQGGDPWPDSSPPEGFCAIILAYSALTFTVSGEGGPPCLTLHVRRADGIPVKPLQLKPDLASSPPGSGKEGDPHGRFVLTSDERLLRLPE